MTHDNIDIAYVPTDPFKIGGNYDPICMFGAYRVTFPDGFACLLPHSGTLGTIGAEPLAVEDPEVRDALVEGANVIRDQFHL